jgi:hypothetical protein
VHCNHAEKGICRFYGQLAHTQIKTGHRQNGEYFSLTDPRPFFSSHLLLSGILFLRYRKWQMIGRELDSPEDQSHVSSDIEARN